MFLYDYPKSSCATRETFSHIQESTDLGDL